MAKDFGRFTWYELLTTDPDAGIEFYKNLLGWGSMAMEGETRYDMFTRGESPTAGVLELPEPARAAGAPPNWLGYVSTPDLDATVAQAKDLGANIMSEATFAGMGRMAVIADPQGAVIATFQPLNAPPPEHDAQNGEVSWHELMTSDYEAAFAFYSTLFGWEKLDDMDIGEHGIYRMYGRNGKPLGGMFNEPAEPPISAWTYYVQVADCHEAASRIAALGGKVVIGPMEVPGGDTVVQAMDPQGARFALHHSAQAAAEA